MSSSPHGSGDFTQLKIDVDDEGSTHSSAEVVSSTNIFVAGLPSAWDEKALLKVLSTFGEIVSIRVVPERRFAFAQFREPQAAQVCISKLHESRVGPEPGTVLHVTSSMHAETADEGPNERLFFRGLPPFATADSLKDIGSRFGHVVDATVVVYQDGRCKGTGFMCFDSVETATACMHSLDGQVIPLRIRRDDGSEVIMHCNLIVKYSETAQSHAARQRRNKERIADRAAQGQSSSPTSLRSNTGTRPSSSRSAGHPLTAPISMRAIGGAQSPMVSLPSPHPANPAAAFGSFLPDGSRETFGQRNSLPTPTLVTAPTLVLRGQTPAFPRSGDVFLGPATAIPTPAAAVSLIEALAEAPLILAPFMSPNCSGYAIRLRNPSHVGVVVDALNGAGYLNGPTLTCWRFA
jgi:RNA recognition motif-containing protein